MNPKEKAKELVEWFADIEYMGRHSNQYGLSVWSTSVLYRQAKQCALKCVDEMMFYAKVLDTIQYPFLEADDTPHNEYLQSVKTEIEKL